MPPSQTPIIKESVSPCIRRVFKKKRRVRRGLPQVGWHVAEGLVEGYHAAIDQLLAFLEVLQT